MRAAPRPRIGFQTFRAAPTVAAEEAPAASVARPAPEPMPEPMRSVNRNVPKAQPKPQTEEEEIEIPAFIRKKML
jgi:hypothetical protein